MTSITAKVIRDSIAPHGVRLRTMELRYPKFIHAEAKTHRLIRIGSRSYDGLDEIGFMDEAAFSRNASSSRAIPVQRMIDAVLNNPVRPTFWGKNQTGMQASEELTGAALFSSQMEWDLALQEAVNRARRMANNGAHKQIVNRILEPFSHIRVVATATEWANFFALRRHEGAQPEMRALAEAMWVAQEASTATLLRPGEWHLPYVDPEADLEAVTAHFGGKAPVGTEFNDYLIRLSVARCARVSYLTHDGRQPGVGDDLNLYERLVGATPLHASPAEHQATPDTNKWGEAPLFNSDIWWDHPNEHGNLVGWRQYRKMLPGERVNDRQGNLAF